jgi:hypothetical protein
MSPDALSPFPDRPIRPLPKKPLRERLSPDVAQTIKYPPAPKTSTSLFYTNGVHSLREEGGANGVVESQHPAERERADEVERNYITRRRGDEGDSDEEVQGLQNQDRSKPLVDISNRSYRFVQSHKTDSKHPNPLPPASTASSADGYDSFENTNNKKKRKIPTPGDSTLTGVHLSSDLAGMGISGPDDLIDESSNGGGSYHSPGSGQGLSGPGRGRYGRIRNGRSPLRTLSDASSNWSNGRSAKQRQSQWPTGRSSYNASVSSAANTFQAKALESYLSQSPLLTRRNTPLHHPEAKRMSAFYYNKLPKSQRLLQRSSPLPAILKCLVQYFGQERILPQPHT